MKVAVSSEGKNLENKVSEVFARAPYFIIAEIEKGKIKDFEIIKNEAQNRMGEAGIFASQLIAEKGVEAVITKNIGPRAFEVLRQFNIKVFSGSGTVKEVLQDFISGKLGEFSP
ncbi:MAG: NifB/NifX family molybdenum-iron cluster-binding protein [Candidatus Nanoarchaeia archaeon]